MREIYLAGGCYWGVEKYISNIKGVLHTSNKIGDISCDLCFKVQKPTKFFVLEVFVIFYALSGWANKIKIAR